MSERKPHMVVSRREIIKVGAGFLAAGATGELSRTVAAQPVNATPDPPNRAVGRPFPKREEEPPLPPSERVGFAVVGLGKFALNQIIPSFAECKAAKLTALVSGDRGKAERVAREHSVPAKNIYGYDNFDAIRDNPDVQVVYIILPNSLHHGFTLRAARAGKHVLCEKPMAVSVPQCEEMISACRNANVKLMIAYRAQYEPYNLEAIRISRGGELGRIVAITADHGRNVDPSDPADQWRLKKELSGGGSLPDIGIYSLNATRYLTGEEPVEIAARIETPNDPRFREVESNVFFELRFPSGVRASCTSSYSYYDTKRFQVFFEKGNLSLDPATDYYRHHMVISRPDPKNPEQSVQDEPQIPEENQFANEMDHMARAVKNNTPVKTPGEEGLQDVRSITAIYEAANTGRPVQLPPMKPPRNETR